MYINDNPEAQREYYAVLDELANLRKELEEITFRVAPLRIHPKETTLSIVKRMVYEYCK